MRADKQKMINMNVIMIASFWIRQVNVPTMLMSIKISAMVDGLIGNFMSFDCRLVFTKIAKQISHKQIFFSKCAEFVGRKSVTPSVSGA
jgi:hypothetical protein